MSVAEESAEAGRDRCRRTAAEGRPAGLWRVGEGALRIARPRSLERAQSLLCGICRSDGSSMGRSCCSGACSVNDITRHTRMKPKRQSIRQFAAEVTAPHTTIARSGFGSDVRFLLQKAYRIGLNNGKLLASK